MGKVGTGGKRGGGGGGEEVGKGGTSGKRGEKGRKRGHGVGGGGACQARGRPAPCHAPPTGWGSCAGGGRLPRGRPVVADLSTWTPSRGRPTPGRPPWRPAPPHRTQGRVGAPSNAPVWRSGRRTGGPWKVPGWGGGGRGRGWCWGRWRVGGCLAPCGRPRAGHAHSVPAACARQRASGPRSVPQPTRWGPRQASPPSAFPSSVDPNPRAAARRGAGAQTAAATWPCVSSRPRPNPPIPRACGRKLPGTPHGAPRCTQCGTDGAGTPSSAASAHRAVQGRAPSACPRTHRTSPAAAVAARPRTANRAKAAFMLGPCAAGGSMDF